jgi:YVTN family beta-propeller protein
MGRGPEWRWIWLYVVNGLSDDLTIVDVASGKAIKTVPAGRVPHSVITN